MMNDSRFTGIRDTLEGQGDDVQKNLDAHEAGLNPPSDNRDFGGADRAQELDNSEADSAVVDREDNLRQQIDHAVERIEAGTYGICEGCAIEIPLARLEAKPRVSLCIPCQEAHENQQRSAFLLREERDEMRELFQ
jgi:DnaK suppressor protein